MLVKPGFLLWKHATQEVFLSLFQNNYLFKHLQGETMSNISRKNLKRSFYLIWGRTERYRYELWGETGLVRCMEFVELQTLSKKSRLNTWPGFPLWRRGRVLLITYTDRTHQPPARRLSSPSTTLLFVFCICHKSSGPKRLLKAVMVTFYPRFVWDCRYANSFLCVQERQPDLERCCHEMSRDPNVTGKLAKRAS